MPWSSFSECWALSQLFLSSFTFIKRLFSYSSLSAIRVVSSAYLRLLIFLPTILIPACVSSSPAFFMMYSAYKLNKQGDNIIDTKTQGGAITYINEQTVPRTWDSTILRTDHKEIGTNGPWNWRLTVPKTFKGGFPGGPEVKTSAWNVGDLGSIPG